MSTYSEDPSDDEQVDWEEVDVEEIHGGRLDSEDTTGKVGFDLVLSKAGEQRSTKKRSANSALERQIRHEVHRMHTITLLTAGVLRNQLLNDPLLKARLLSLVPLPLVNAFHTFTPETHPLDRDRSRLFDSALKDLISWWWQSFQVNNSFEGMISRSWSDAEVLYQNSDDVTGKGKAKGNHPEDQFLQLLESGEPIHGVKSLMKRALLMKGSRDMSAQLFTSCLRALDIPARLVFSLQPVTWRGAGAGGKSANPAATTQDETVTGGSKSENKINSGVNPTKPKSRTAQNAKSKSKRGEWATKAEKAAKAIKAKSVRIDNQTQSLRGTDEGEDEEGDLNSQVETVPVASSSRHSPVIKLRKSRPPTKSRNWAKSPSPEPQEMNRTPVFWTEVYSRPMKEWYCVDVTRKKMRCKNIMEPSRNNPENKMIYVIAYEEDNFIRDVTARYAHSFGATTMKSRLPSKKNEEDWFERATAILKRPYKLGRDIKEDTEIEKARVTEAMPTTVTGFKNHPKYALERHLRREEVIYPKRPIGTFRGDSVYPRSSVIVCKSTETYMREGKRVKGGENPLKMVKPRAVTINRKRETELLKMDGQPVPLQGLFAEWQTELLIPPPIVDGVVPRNGYGNFDLFAPHMLPQGAKHLPYKGIAKTAKKLKVSYADAVVSFEFHRSRATPLIDGIIVPELDAEFVLDAYWTSEEAQEVKEFEKLEERCLKRWKKLIIGLRIRQRLQREYGPQATQASDSQQLTQDASKSRKTNSQQTSTSFNQPSIAALNSELDHSKLPFELYTDHQMNPMIVPQADHDGDHIPSKDLRHSEPADLEEPTVADVFCPRSGKAVESETLPCSPSLTKECEESLEIDTPRKTRQSTRVSRTTQPIKLANNSKGIKRKSASEHALGLTKQTPPKTGSRSRQTRRNDSIHSIDQDPYDSSPLTSPPSASEHSDYSAILSPPKRAKVNPKSPKELSVIPRESSPEDTPDKSPRASTRPTRRAAVKANENISLTSAALGSKRTLRSRK
ncbi:hypothetical protein PGT21_016568 [Puccinia graminis f. sp. tritici]|uniref:Xeroderma pigmentosum group C-complementing protein n=1 Tax=Puccinia graminis f. sp. tritici TaxID=56615 RepID=A0A5B0S3S7_PUCGR|nr:hypothetical protein PGT21_016568 [Puccinia graminis f. sp. tritici]KAA1132005.1 hypothetical protein PGTUg99_035587 [Puccinia graminis f. sp. tritici]